MKKVILVFTVYYGFLSKDKKNSHKNSLLKGVLGLKVSVFLGCCCSNNVDNLEILNYEPYFNLC